MARGGMLLPGGNFLVQFREVAVTVHLMLIAHFCNLDQTLYSKHSFDYSGILHH